VSSVVTKSCLYFGFVGPAIPPVLIVYFDTESLLRAFFGLITYPVTLLFGGLIAAFAGLIYIGVFLFVIQSKRVKFKINHEGDLLLVGLASSVICILALALFMLGKEFDIEKLVSLLVAPTLFCGLSFPLFFQSSLLNIVNNDRKVIGSQPNNGN